MRQVQKEELSALLDGELSPQRAEEVRARIEADPALREQFDALVHLDARLRRAIEQVAFIPNVVLSIGRASEIPAWHWPAGIVVVLVLIGTRLLPKLAELPLFGVGVQVAACAAISFIVVRMAREAESLATSGFGKVI